MSENPHDILGPGKMKNEREIVEGKEETAGSQPCKRKRLTEVFKAPTEQKSEKTAVLDLGISKDRE